MTGHDVVRDRDDECPRTPLQAPPGVPLFSVIVPNHERAEQLGRCLEALARLERGGDRERVRFETIVVDDGSRQALDVNGLPAAGRPAALRVLRQANAGPAVARNTGAAAARGTFLVFLDDDCRPCDGWLEHLADAVARHPEALLGGPVVNGCTDLPCSEASQQLVDYLYRYYDGANGSARFFCSTNLVVSRAAFERVGGFDSRFPIAAGEDRLFCLAWSRAGRPSVAVPGAVVTHHHAMGLRGFVRQHLNYGAGAFRMRQVLHEDRERGAEREPLGFYTGLVTHPLRTLPPGRGLVCAALLLLAQLANAAGYFRARGA